MRVPSKAQGWLLGTLIVGGGVIAAAVVLRRGDVSTATLALLAAAVVLAEMLQVEGDETSPDPGDVHSLSFSSTIHLATALIIGPWTAAVVAAFGVLVVDPMRGAPWRVVAYNASVFGLAAAVGGHVFLLAGGAPGSLELPASFPAIAALAVAYYLVNYAFQSAIVGLHRRRSLLVLMRDASRDGLPAAVGEAGLAVAIAFFAFHEPLAIVALAPLMFAVYRSYERLATMRRETARALETFANVVSERDSSKYELSARVADLVNRLAEALDLPQSDVARLRWAGRLHDLGKISVDAAVLRKPSRLDDDEWATMRLHPRLSARLLRRFRFAADQAKAVEYHHERFDGLGYYGIDPDEIPMAAHFLIVADSFDAMTSDRAYRAGLPREVALAEIEKHAGTQFHPAVAKAFLALERRQDPRGVLTREELRALRRAFRSRRRPALPLRRVFTLDRVMGGAVIAGLTAVAG